MAAVAFPTESEVRDEVRREDSIVVLSGLTWADYQRLLEIRGDHSAPRITYCEGTVEIMSPSRNHEAIKSLIGCLVEAFCFERGIRFSTFGSWTLEDKKVDRGVEPDECYVFGRGPERTMPENPERPDLAIEIVWTSGGIKKLDVYRKLGVREVWFWRLEKLQVHELRGEQYEPTPRSGVLPDIDLEQLVSFLDRPTTSDAVLAYREALKSAAEGGAQRG